jgi:phosphatidylglycerophosphate synthase
MPARAKALLTTLATFATLLGLMAMPALAALKSDGGEGAYGDTDDVVITNFGFGLIIFFVLFVTVMSILQYLLQRRKRHR